MGVDDFLHGTKEMVISKLSMIEKRDKKRYPCGEKFSCTSISIVAKCSKIGARHAQYAQHAQFVIPYTHYA